jgi:hypothetical protein
VPGRQPSTGADRVILVCRAGRLFGADPSGRVYTGVLKANSSKIFRRSCLKVACQTPRRRRPMARQPSRRAVAAVGISGEIDPGARRQNTTIFVGGRPVDIEITYLGPLPK